MKRHTTILTMIFILVWISLSSAISTATAERMLNTQQGFIWHILKSNNGSYNQYASFQFGTTAPDVTVVEDYDGDGKSDVAVFRPSEGMWYIAKPEGNPAQNFYGIQWGVSTDIPISSLASLQ